MDKRFEFIKEQMKVGKDKETIRRELVMNGFSTDGYDELYAAIERGDAHSTKTDAPATDLPQGAVVEPAAGGSDAPVALPTVTQFIRLTFTRFFKRSDLLLPAFGLFLAGLLPFFAVAVMLGIEFFNQGNLNNLLLSSELLITTVALFAAGLLTVSLTGLFLKGSLMYVYGRYAEHRQFKEGLHWTWRHFLPLVWLGILTATITFGGFMLFIVPGVLFVVYSFFSTYVLITEDRRGMQAILRSIDLVRGAFWGLFGRLLVLWLLLGAASMIIGTLAEFASNAATFDAGVLTVGVFMLHVVNLIIQVCIGWIGLLGVATLLEYRRAAKPTYDPLQHRGLTVVLWIGAALGTALILGIIAIIFLSVLYFEQYRASMPGGSIQDLEEDWYMEGSI